MSCSSQSMMERGRSSTRTAVTAITPPGSRHVYTGGMRKRAELRHDRRQFLQGGLALALAGLGLLVGCDLPRLPWQQAKVPRVGLLSLNPERTVTSFLEAFLQELGSLGYVEGQTFRLEARYADDRADRLSGLADELVRLPADV